MQKKTFRMFAAGSLIVSLSLFVGGCGKKEVASDADMEAQDKGYEEVVVDVGEDMGSEESIESQPYAGLGSEISEARTHAPMLPVYFDFDRFNIREDQIPRIETNSVFLKDNMTVKIAIMGNCDERGTQEYNIALGERRALSAKKFVVNMGVAEYRVSTISFGEEKPLVHGHDEFAWAQNRRDDFVITSK